MELLRWMVDLACYEYCGEHFALDGGSASLGATGEIAIIYIEDF